MISTCVPSGFQQGKKRQDEKHIARTWLHSLFFQSYNILSFRRFSSLVFMMTYTVLPANALAGTPLCQYKEEFQKFLEEIKISKLKYVPFSCLEKGCHAGDFFPQPVFLGYVISRYFWIGILGFPKKCWDISAPHKPSNSPLAPGNSSSLSGMTDLLISYCTGNFLKDNCKVLQVLSTKT